MQPHSHIAVRNREDQRLFIALFHQKSGAVDTVQKFFFIDDDLKITQRVADFFKDKENKHSFLSTTDYNKKLPAPEGVERILDFKDFEKKVNLYLKKK